MNERISLRRRMIFTSYASILISIILISVVSYILLSNNSKKLAIQTNQDIVARRCDNIELLLDRMELVLRNTIYNPELQSLLTEYNVRSNGTRYDLKVRINKEISSSTNSLYNVDNVVLFAANGDVIGSMVGFDVERRASSYSWYDEVEQSTGSTCWISELCERRAGPYGNHYIVPVVKKIRSISVGETTLIGSNIGYMLAFLNIDSVISSLQISDGFGVRNMMLVSESGRVIASNDEAQIGCQLDSTLTLPENNNTYIAYKGENYLLNFKKLASPLLNWKIVCMANKRDIQRDANVSLLICMSVSAVLLLAFLLVSIRNADLLTSSLETLRNSFSLLEKGNFDISIQQKIHISEFDDMISHFNHMVCRLDTLIYEVYEAQIKEQRLIADVRQAEIKALQMQINPHFLYNTLDSINWIALMGQNYDVSKMVLALGNLFRSNMDMRDIYTTVEKEIKNIELFMYLEKMRFGDKLSYDTNVTPGLEKCSIIKLLLQPLVENSIKHGIEPHKIAGKISISIYQESHMLVIKVEDNGKGMPIETLSKLRTIWLETTTADEGTEETDGGVGLFNIMKRLRLCYSNDVRFEISSKPNCGTCTMIIFPMSK